MPEQGAVVPQRLRDLARRGEDEVVDVAQAGVGLPGAAEQQQDEERADHRRSASSACSRIAISAGSVTRRGRGSGTSRTACTRAGRGLQHDDPVGEHRRLLDVVRDEQRGARFAGERAREPVAHLRAGDRVQRAERLVEAQERLAAEQRAQERDALAHPAGELVRAGMLEALEAEGGEERLGALACLVAARAVDPQRERGVVERVEPGQQEIALGHEDRRGRGHAPAVRFLQPAHELEQRGLAAAGRPDERDDLVLGHVERDGLDGRDGPGPAAAGGVREADVPDLCAGRVLGARPRVPGRGGKSRRHRSLRGHYPSGSTGPRRLSCAFSAGLRQLPGWTVVHAIVAAHAVPAGGTARRLRQLGFWSTVSA